MFMYLSSLFLDRLVTLPPPCTNLYEANFNMLPLSTCFDNDLLSITCEHETTSNSCPMSILIHFCNYRFIETIFLGSWKARDRYTSHVMADWWHQPVPSRPQSPQSAPNLQQPEPPPPPPLSPRMELRMKLPEALNSPPPLGLAPGTNAAQASFLSALAIAMPLPLKHSESKRS